MYLPIQISMSKIVPKKGWSVPNCPVVRECFFSRPDDGEAGRLIAKILSSHELPHRPQVGRDPFTHSKTIGNENLVLNLSYTSSK